MGRRSKASGTCPLTGDAMKIPVVSILWQVSLLTLFLYRCLSLQSTCIIAGMMMKSQTSMKSLIQLSF